MKEVLSVSDDGEHPIEIGHDVELFYSDSARVMLKLMASKVERYTPEVSKTVFSDGLHIQFLDVYGRVETDMKADHATKYEKELRTIATGNVVVINHKGERLNTEELVWDERKELITTDKFVTVTTESQVIMGDGLEADQQFSWYEIKNVTGTLAIKEDGQD